MTTKLKTHEVAAAIGVHPNTLKRWIAKGKLRAPKPVLIGAVGMRLWDAADIERVKAYKVKFFRKGRGRKRQK